MKILDVGTGPGFFAIIMSLAGHEVTAIDCTQAMPSAMAFAPNFSYQTLKKWTLPMKVSI